VRGYGLLGTVWRCGGSAGAGAAGFLIETEAGQWAAYVEGQVISYTADATSIVTPNKLPPQRARGCGQLGAARRWGG